MGLDMYYPSDFLHFNWRVDTDNYKKGYYYSIHAPETISCLISLHTKKRKYFTLKAK